MRKLILSAVLLTFPFGASAQEMANGIGYVEGSIGINIASTVNTKTFTIIVPPDTVTGHGELDYGNNLVAGAEIGWAGFGGGNWRAGIGYDYSRLKLDSASLVGSVNGITGSITANASQIRSAGYDFDNSVHLVTGNLYYNLPGCSETYCGYLGVGAGTAIIEHADSQFALSATAGVRVGIGPSSYVGLRYRYYRVAGPTDDAGVQYDPVNFHTISAVIGFYLQ